VITTAYSDSVQFGFLHIFSLSVRLRIKILRIFKVSKIHEFLRITGSFKTHKIQIITSIAAMFLNKLYNLWRMRSLHTLVLYWPKCSATFFQCYVETILLVQITETSRHVRQMSHRGNRQAHQTQTEVTFTYLNIYLSRCDSRLTI